MTENLITIESLIDENKKASSEEEIIEFVRNAHGLITDTTKKYSGSYGHFAREEYYEENWVVQIYIAVSRYFFCTYVKGRRPVVSRRNGKPRMACVHTVVGAEPNVKAVHAVANHLIEMSRRIAKEATKKEHKRRPVADMRPFENNFKRKFGSSIAERIRKMRDDTTGNQEIGEIFNREDTHNDTYVRDILTSNTKHPPIAGDGFIDGRKEKSLLD